MRILVLHGPNLNLLGEREGDEKGRSLADLNALISQRAAQLGLEVKILQSNHEGVLVDTLHAERKWAEGIIINPAALTHPRASAWLPAVPRPTFTPTARSASQSPRLIRPGVRVSFSAKAHRARSRGVRSAVRKSRLTASASAGASLASRRSSPWASVQ